MKRNHSTELTPRGELTIEQVAAFRQELVSALAAADRLTISLAEATQIDLSFLQLLCSAHRTAVSQRKELVLIGVSTREVEAVLREAGFSRHIGCTLDCNRSCIWVAERPG